MFSSLLTMDINKEEQGELAESSFAGGTLVATKASLPSGQVSTRPGTRVATRLETASLQD